MTMIDVSSKSHVLREATATGKIILKENTVNLIKNKKIAKGDPIFAAKIAAVQRKRAAKKLKREGRLPMHQGSVDKRLFKKYGARRGKYKDASKFPNRNI